MGKRRYEGSVVMRERRGLSPPNPHLLFLQKKKQKNFYIGFIGQDVFCVLAPMRRGARRGWLLYWGVVAR